MAESAIAPDWRSRRPTDPGATGRDEVRGWEAEIYAPCRGGIGTARFVVAKRLFAKMKAIADTGFIVAFGNHEDTHHSWAVDISKRIREPLLTCEAVLAEAAFQLASVDLVFALVRDEMLRVAFDLTRNLDQLADLAHRYRDRKPDLADLCLVRMSELYPRYVVITVDSGDFRVYRRNKREVIPILCPPIS
jgi:uncharacterized protein